MLPAQFVGQTLYFEFPSFNLVGGGEQSLAETTIYNYVPVGSSVIPGIFPVAVIKDNRTASRGRRDLAARQRDPLESH